MSDTRTNELRRLDDRLRVLASRVADRRVPSIARVQCAIEANRLRRQRRNMDRSAWFVSDEQLFCE